MNKHQEYQQQSVFKRGIPEEKFVSEKIPLLNVSYSKEEALTWLLESLDVFFMHWWTQGWRQRTSYQIVKSPDAEDEIQALYGASLLNKHTGGKQVRRE